MDFEMIINCRVPCMWMRLRDKVLHILSFALWAMLLVVLLRIEITQIVDFFSSFYLAMLGLLVGPLLAWSYYRKYLFVHALSKHKNRRNRFTAIAPKVSAVYFRIDEHQVCALQGKKSAMLQHCNQGHISHVTFIENPPTTNEPRKNTHYHAAA